MMKKLVLGAVLIAFVTYGAPLFACDCDTAAALQLGLKDRLHQPWPGDPEHPANKAKKSTSGSSEVGGPRQDMPMNMGQDAKPQTELKK